MTKLKAIVFQTNQSHCSSPQNYILFNKNTKALFTEHLPLPAFYNCVPFIHRHNHLKYIIMPIL